MPAPRTFLKDLTWMVQTETPGVQSIVQTRLCDGFGDIQIGGDLTRRPAQVVRLTDHFSMRRMQLIERVADSTPVEELIHLIGSWRVYSAEPAWFRLRGHEVATAFITTSRLPARDALPPPWGRCRNGGGRAARSTDPCCRGACPAPPADR